MSFFKKKHVQANIDFHDNGITFSNTPVSECTIYLDQLLEIGFVSQTPESPDSYFLSWSSLYELADDALYMESLPLLGLPESSDVRPVLSSQGALTDTNFQINLDGWCRSDGVPLRDWAALKITGGLIDTPDQTFLLKKPVWAVIDAIRQFARIPHTVAANYQHWGKIRRLALEAGANLDDFLHKTIVLTPETLKLEFERLQDNAIQVSPGFDDAPPDWLNNFDRIASIPEYYHLTQAGGGIIHVAISEPVKQVLEEIKRMPGRVARSKRAIAFIHNPYTVLGEAATTVLPPESYEYLLHQSGIVFYTFDLSEKTDSKGNILSVSLILEATRSGVFPSTHKFDFVSCNELYKLMDEIKYQLQAGFPCFNWQGYEVELRGNAKDKLEQLQAWHERWLNPVLAVTYEEIYEFPEYAERVIRIGKREPYYSPFIFRTDAQAPWLDTNTLIGIGTKPDSPVLLIRTKEELEQFKTATLQARQDGREVFYYPGLDKKVSVQEAEEMIPLIEKVVECPQNDRTLSAPINKSPDSRKGLLIETNIQTVGYTEGHADSGLLFDKSRADGLELPPCLNADLKAHQRIGIAWLQHLWRNSPVRYSGCVMADDMGLGKTLQLLTFIIWYLDQPDALPALIVAPVSLLENWQNEIKKFFRRDCVRVLTLYGNALAEKKVPQSVIDERLRNDGLTRFLVDDWLDKANLVLTTYETLRDLSISLGQQPWGVMVCDEAQKIKTPGALVTDAAKAQKAGFKIACTGTPVENSLTDLWCLFDFVQPGLLGALNYFGATYRRPIESADGTQNDALNQLRELIEPQLLRRTKQDVARDLPKKYDDSYPDIRDKNRIPLSDYQHQLYREEIGKYQHLNQVAANAEQRNNPILTVIHRLRGICVDPRETAGLQPDLGQSVKDYRKKSPKFDWLLDRLDEIRKKQEKVLIFTEYLDLQRALAHFLSQHYRISPRIINGSVKSSSNATESRQKLIDVFQASHGFNILILSPKAAGFGLNIQAANHVIHYTRPWNPAVEDQATDRAYRIGQTKDVYVYYPTVYSDKLLTFEAKLDDLLRSKRELARDMLNGTSMISQDELIDLLQGQGAPYPQHAAWITENDLPRIVSHQFEALCRALLTSEGYVCLPTPKTRDGGIDIVAIKNKTKGLLIQCKGSVGQDELGWAAVRDVVAGTAAYQIQFPETTFSKVAITNQTFNDTAKNQARVNQVTLYDRTDLVKWLAQYPQRLSVISTM